MPAERPSVPTTEASSEQKKADEKIELEQLKSELGIDEAYMKKLEEQKQMRQRLAEAKASKRKLFASICDKSATGQLPLKTSMATTILAAKTLLVQANNKVAITITTAKVTEQSEPANVVPPTNKELPQHNTEVVNKTDNTTEDVVKPTPTTTSSTAAAVTTTTTSTTVQISGLSEGMRESAIRKLCRPYGMVSSIEFKTIDSDGGGGTRRALVRFAEAAQAKRLVDTCPTVTLEDRTLAIQFYWFVMLLIT